MNSLTRIASYLRKAITNAFMPRIISSLLKISEYNSKDIIIEIITASQCDHLDGNLPKKHSMISSSTVQHMFYKPTTQSNSYLGTRYNRCNFLQNLEHNTFITLS